MKNKMHMEYTLPGGVTCPPLIDIVDRKISIVYKLLQLSEGKGEKFTSQPGRDINEMIDIEMRAIYEMISVDKNEDN